MGLLTDLLGGAAISAHGVLQRDNKAREEAEAKAAENEASLARQKTMADYQADIAMKKQLMLEELAAEREQRKQKDFANAADQAETRSSEIGTDRRFQKFVEDGKQAGYFEGMSPEQIKEVFEQTYDDKRVNAESGGDRYQDKTLAVKADDYVKASRETGNSGLLTQALNDRKTAIGQDKSNVENALKERKLNQDAINAERKDELGWARIEALVNGKAGGKSTEIRDTLNLIDSKRKTIASEEDNLIRMMQNASRPSEKAPLQKRLDALALERDELKEMQRALTTRLSGDPQPTGSANSQGRAYLGTDQSGRTVYGPSSVPDVKPSDLNNLPKTSLKSTPAEMDKSSIYANELEKAVAMVQATKPGTPERRRAENDVRAIESEIKRIGGSVNTAGRKSGNEGQPTVKVIGTEMVPVDAKGIAVPESIEPTKRVAEKPAESRTVTAEAPRTASPKPANGLLAALNPGGNAALDAVVAPKVKQIEGLSVLLKQAQQKTAAVAKTGNTQDILAAAKEQQQIRSMLDKLLSGMEPGQVSAILKAAGIA